MELTFHKFKLDYTVPYKYCVEKVTIEMKIDCTFMKLSL